MMDKIGRLDRAAVAREVAGAGTYHAREIDDLAGDEPRVVQQPNAQRNVDVLADNIDNSVGDQEIACDLGVARQEIRQHRYEMMDGYDREGMHAQVPARREARG